MVVLANAVSRLADRFDPFVQAGATAMQPEPETTLTGSNGSHRVLWAEHAENGKDPGAHHPRLVITCYRIECTSEIGLWVVTVTEIYSRCVEVWAQKGKSWLLKSHHQIKIPIRNLGFGWKM